MEPVTKSIAYSRETILSVLRDLNAIVVSLDRVGSASAGLNRAQQDLLLSKFFTDFEVFRKLAEARRLLSDGFSSEQDDDGMDGLERELQDLTYWDP